MGFRLGPRVHDPVLLPLLKVEKHIRYVAFVDSDVRLVRINQAWTPERALGELRGEIADRDPFAPSVPDESLNLIQRGILCRNCTVLLAFKIVFHRRSK